MMGRSNSLANAKSRSSCAGTVAHHDVVGDPDRNLLAVDGVDGVAAGGNARLLLRQLGALQVGLGGALGPVGLDLVALLGDGDAVDQRVLGREDHVGGAEQGVGPRGEDGHGLAVDGEVDLGPFTAADPVALQQLDALGPVEVLELVDEPLGVGGDAQHPLLQGTALHGVALGAPFLHLLVGEDGAEVGRPVHGRLGDVSEAALVDFVAAEAFLFQFRDGPGALGLLVEPGMVELQEDPLGPAHVAGIGGVDLAVPVVGEAEPLQLAAEGGDVVLRVLLGVFAGLDGVLLGGQAEGIPAHGVEHVEAPHPLVAGHDVGGGVALGVADVESRPAGVGEHVEDVVFRAGRVEAHVAGIGDGESLLGLPMRLPGGLELVEGELLASLRHRFVG